MNNFLKYRITYTYWPDGKDIIEEKVIECDAYSVIANPELSLYQLQYYIYSQAMTDDLEQPVVSFVKYISNLTGLEIQDKTTDLEREEATLQ